MTEVISQTTPVPPTGTTSTITPLGISAATSATTQPLTNPVIGMEKLKTPHGLILGTFPIGVTNASGSRVYDWRAKYPLGSTSNPYTSVIFGDTIIYCVPWDLVIPFFSKQTKIEWDIKFTPIKVADSRVNIDFIVNYNDNLPIYSTNALSNDTFHKMVDEQDDPLVISAPLYWQTELVQTDGYINSDFNTSATKRMQPAFLPETRIAAFVRNRFTPNQMQPTTFYMLVELFPKPQLSLGFASKGMVRCFNPTLIDFLPTPYFMNYE